ncbi:MAG TPA: NrfD/PsrC family molybdoenzyme membrane anchor subunit [Woeseiaceae bacterium]
MTTDAVVHGFEWTVKELFVYPNEYIYWSIQIVMYPYMTGLVAGAFVLSSLYHVFGQKDLKEIAQFSLVFSLALLPVAALPLLLHLQQPTRAMEPLLTPHFTSAIAAFGIVFTTYGLIVLSEIWFVYREYFVAQLETLKGAPGFWNMMRRHVYGVLTFKAKDVGAEALRVDHKAAKILAGVGIPVACFLHGYAGFIFGSVKANALWMSPLMPVIFIMSAVVSGIALCMLTYIVVMEWQAFWQRRKGGTTEAGEIKGAEADVITKATRYLLGFLVAAISLELLDLIFRGYTAMKSWDILREVMYTNDFFKIFILQYTLGNLVPFVLLLLPGRTIKRTMLALLLVLFGVFMMRWNVVIGGQAFSLSFSGFMHYHIPVIPHSLETFKEGVFGALAVIITPFVLFWIINKFIPGLKRGIGEA